MTRTGLVARFVAFGSFLGASSAIAFAAMTSEGCTVTTGNGDAGDFSFDSGSGGNNDSGSGTTQGDPACNSCLFQSCNGQWAVCQQSSECMAIYQCATKTGCDQKCVTDCFNAHPNGQKEYTALYTCDQAGACTQSCAGVCKTDTSTCPSQGTTDAGQTTNDSGTPPPADCSGCTAQKCATESGKCGTGSDCDKYSQCVNACTDLNCINTCGQTYAQGKTDSEALANCTTAQCKTECGL